MDRRCKHVPCLGKDRRKRWGDRRQHDGFFRWLWFPVEDAFPRAKAAILRFF